MLVIRFNHDPWPSIKKDNVLIWLSWSCFNLPLEDVRANPVWSTFLDRSLELLEARTGTTFPEGFDRTISTLRLTMDPVNAKGRPLLLHAISSGVNCWLREVVQSFQGMMLCREGPVEYLIRIPKGWTPDKGRTHPNAMPIVYLHGLGFGLIQNHLLIKHLIQSLPTHPLVVPLAYHTQLLWRYRGALRKVSQIRVELYEDRYRPNLHDFVRRAPRAG
jgi:hypothetical protein